MQHTSTSTSNGQPVQAPRVDPAWRRAVGHYTSTSQGGAVVLWYNPRATWVWGVALRSKAPWGTVQVLVPGYGLVQAQVNHVATPAQLGLDVA